MCVCGVLNKVTQYACAFNKVTHHVIRHKGGREVGLVLVYTGVDQHHMAVATEGGLGAHQGLDVDHILLVCNTPSQHTHLNTHTVTLFSKVINNNQGDFV